jgi:hypothetical protein
MSEFAGANRAGLAGDAVPDCWQPATATPTRRRTTLSLTDLT